MTEDDKNALREKIKEEIKKLKVDIARLEEATKPISPENSLGRVSRMDAINNKGVAEASLRSAKSKMSKLQIAVSKIELPGFGNCANCKQPIRPARLMFMPESTRCIRCADRR